MVKLSTVAGFVVAGLAVVAGVVLYTSLPKRLGYYRWLASRSPALVGMTPAYSYQVPWGFTMADVSQLDLVGQTALVTGANSGLGYATAALLIQQGANVVLACRNPKKCQVAAEQIHSDQNPVVVAGGRTTTMTVDTSSLASVQQFATDFAERFKSLDMLFLNAGGLVTDPMLDCVPLSVDGIESVFAGNYLGHHLLFRLLEPLLVPGARVVSTSSAASFASYSYQVATDLETLNGCSEPITKGINNLSYGQSKLAQILWTKAVTRRRRPETTEHPIYVNAYHPGAVATDIWAKAFEQAKAPRLMVEFSEWLQRESMWTAKEGALTGIYLGTVSTARGTYFHPQTVEVVNPVALNETLQDALWDFSENLVKEFLPKESNTEEVTAEDVVAES